MTISSLSLGSKTHRQKPPTKTDPSPPIQSTPRKFRKSSYQIKSVPFSPGMSFKESLATNNSPLIGKTTASTSLQDTPSLKVLRKDITFFERSEAELDLKIKENKKFFKRLSGNHAKKLFLFILSIFGTIFFMISILAIFSLISFWSIMPFMAIFLLLTLLLIGSLCLEGPVDHLQEKKDYIKTLKERFISIEENARATYSILHAFCHNGQFSEEMTAALKKKKALINKAITRIQEHLPVTENLPVTVRASNFFPYATMQCDLVTLGLFHCQIEAFLSREGVFPLLKTIRKVDKRMSSIFIGAESPYLDHVQYTNSGIFGWKRQIRTKLNNLLRNNNRFQQEIDPFFQSGHIQETKNLESLVDHFSDGYTPPELNKMIMGTLTNQENPNMHCLFSGAR